MKKILLVPEFSMYGGTMNYFIRLLEFYKNNKYDLVVVISNKQYDEKTELLIKQYGCKHYIIRERRKGIFRFLDFFPFNILNDIYTILPIYLKEKPDMIVVSNGTPGMFISLILLPSKFLYVFHTYPLKSKSFVLTIIQKMFLGLFLNSKKRLMTVSEYSKQQILKYWVINNKKDYIDVIYNSTKNIQSFTMNKNEIGSYIILTLGHVEWYKNPKIWIDVARNVIPKRPNMDIRFIWAGDGSLIDECRNLVSLSESENIKFIGYYEKVDSLYNDCIIYFQPSILESHGMSVVDAMSHGISCITSDVGGLPESVINNETGFTCPPKNVECYVSCIIKLLDDSNFRDKIGLAGKLRVEMFFSEEVQNKKMTDLYTSLL